MSKSTSEEANCILRKHKESTYFHKDMYRQSSRKVYYELYRSYAATYIKIVCKLGYKFADISAFPTEKYQHILAKLSK